MALPQKTERLDKHEGLVGMYTFSD